MPIFNTTLRGSCSAVTLDEIFIHTLGINSTAPQATVAQAVADAWSTQWQTAGGLSGIFTPEITYVEATAAEVLPWGPIENPDSPNVGKIIPQFAAASHALFAGGGMPGTGTGDSLPSQNALAISLSAGVRPNDTPFRGRFYLPAMAADVIGPDGTMDTLVRDNVASKVAAFIQELANAGHTPIVWSRVTEGLFGVVTQIRVGNKMDTIRRRRNQLPEAYAETSITF